MLVVVVVGIVVLVDVDDGVDVEVVDVGGATEGPAQESDGAAAAGAAVCETSNVDAPASKTPANPACTQRERTVVVTDMRVPYPETG